VRRPSLSLTLAAAALTLAACSSSGGSTADSVTPTASPTSSPTSSSASPSPAGTAIEVTVAGKTVTPAPSTISASPGEQISLTLTSDRGGEMHVHPADPELETEIAPGTKTYTFTVTEQPGVYEVELHDPDLLLFEIKVQ